MPARRSRRVRWGFPGLALELHRSEAEGYFLNLTAPQPSVFVLWRTFDDGAPVARPVLATVSYNEAARMMDGGEQVDAVAMPLPVRDWLAPFVAEHYKTEPKKKVRRNAANGTNTVTTVLVNKSAGVRYRSFANTGGDEIYLGVGDLGVAANRAAKQYQWATSGSGTYQITFTYDPANTGAE